MRLLGVLILLLMAAPTAAAAADRLTLVDLTDDFATAWAETQALPETERPAAVEAHFAPILPGFYSPDRFSAARRPGYERRLLAALKAFPEDRSGIEAVSRRFEAMFQPARTAFEARFGPMRGYPPIYLVHSLGEFDGGTRELPGGNPLMFGADMIARLHMAHDIRPFFHHELFHLYHQRSFPGCEEVWCSLWTEGLATYVAKDLNPWATDEELLLTLPEPIRPAVEKDRAAAVCTVAAQLDSRDEAVQTALFSFGHGAPGALPPRYGYYVGYLAAEELGRTRSTEALAKLGPRDVRPLLAQALLKLAGGACPRG